MRKTTRITAALVGATALVLPLAGPVAAAPSGSGATGAGDPYFPRQGNGGYDVAHYGLTLRYDTVGRRLRGRAAVTAVTTQRLTRFDLDLRRSLVVRSVTVDGVRARFSQPASLVQELVIRPRTAVAAGASFRVVVRYAGRPKAITDPDGSQDGWIETSDGNVTLSEPQGSPSWYPCNDTPTDKATYDVKVTVPPGITAISNGELVSRTPAGKGWRTFTWHNGQPMATYLSTVTTGKFRVTTSTTPAGIPVYLATDPTVSRRSAKVLGKVPAMTDYFTSLYGLYPFDSIGAVVDNAPDVGYALENQTKPIYDRPPDQATVAHEISHMWFGDSVTLRRWRDIWVNEGFAEFSVWMWSEQSGGRAAQTYFTRLYAKKGARDLWNPPPGNPGGPVDMFGRSVYERGAMTLQALRVKVGDAVFFPMLRSWYASHVYGTVSVKDFTSYAEAYTGQDLTAFFTAWLYTKGRPKTW